MIKVANCACTLEEALKIPYGRETDDATLRGIAARALGVPVRQVASAEVLRRSVDARKRGEVRFVLTLAASLRDGRGEQALVESGKAQPHRPYAQLRIQPVGNPLPEDARPVVVGMGPAGLFAALYLARAGLRPLVVERGADVRARMRAVRAFDQGGRLDPRTNIQFGEGGAGTFSDGKLTTGTKHPYAHDVLHWFVDAGAPRQILWDAKPHIGSDVLPDVVEALRGQVIGCGGEVRFLTRLVDVRFDGDGRLCAVELEGPDGARSEVAARTLVLACGHSARDTFAMLHERGLAMEQKSFSMGVRIEHRQEDVDAAQYGPAAGHPALGAAEYKMAVHVDERRSAYTFCMCPGGEVVCAASEEGGICTNGMSNLARDGRNANAALLVNVDPRDFGADDPLAGVRLQREVERRAFLVARAAGAAAYQAPAQTVGDFLARAQAGESGQKAAGGLSRPARAQAAGATRPAADAGARGVEPTYARGVVACDLHDVLPGFVCDTLQRALPLFDRKLRGFASPGAVMTAPETRSSSPVRIVRDEGFQAQRAAGDGSQPKAGCGIYPCGEGPGYAGGIMSAAADGMRVAARVTQDLREAAYAQTFDAAVRALRRGAAVVFPTDTVAGLGVSAGHAASPGEIFRIKRRDEGKPVAWLVAGPEALAEYGRDVPQDAVRLARRHWPGPLTIVVKASERVPRAFQSAEGTIGLRMPDCQAALALVRAVGCPIATSSANLAGDPAPGTPEEAVSQVREAAAATLADGTVPSGLASTVVDCTSPAIRTLRQGAVTVEPASGPVC